MGQNGREQLVSPFVDQNQDDSEKSQWEKRSQIAMKGGKKNRRAEQRHCAVAALFDIRVQDSPKQRFFSYRRQKDRRKPKADTLSRADRRLQDLDRGLKNWF